MIEFTNITKIFGPNPELIMNMINDGVDNAVIKKNKGNTIGLREVSFKLNEGEILTIMGLSGSGKSTLLKIVNGLIHPTFGYVSLYNKKIDNLSSREIRELRLRSISMVFQGHALFPHRNVMKNISFGLELQDSSFNYRSYNFDQILDQVGLSGFEEYYPHQLSGGMQQRVGLARALATGAPILLMDEPFSSLDSLTRREMQDLLISLQKRLNKTIIFVTHDFPEALKLGHNMVILRDGEIVQQGKGKEIVKNPIDDYVREILK